MNGLEGRERIRNTPYSQVKSRVQLQSLYKPSNIKRLVSFYQLNDTLGLKIDSKYLRFGILGSPIYGADLNLHIKDQGDSGHGEISYDEDVLKIFRSEMKKLKI